MYRPATLCVLPRAVLLSCAVLWLSAAAVQAHGQPLTPADALERGLAGVARALAAAEAEPVETTAGAQARAAFAEEVLRFVPLAEAFLAQPELADDDRAYVEGELLTALELRGVRLLELERCEEAAQQLADVLADARLQRDGLQRLAALTRERLADATACVTAGEQTREADVALASGDCAAAAALHGQARQAIAGLHLPVLAQRVERLGARLVVCMSAPPNSSVLAELQGPGFGPLPADRRAVRLTGVSLLVAGGVALGAGGLMAGLAADAEHDANAIRRAGQDLRSYQALRQDAYSRATTANALLIGGGAVAAVGLLLRLLAGPVPDTATARGSGRPDARATASTLSTRFPL